MNKNDLIKKRFIELSERAYEKNYYTFTNFLGLAETDILNSTGIKNVILFGGCEDCERVVAAFGDSEVFGYDPDFPVSCIKIEPVFQKFADRFTHRDFLGSLMNLGIERETLGDIIISDNVGYVFCLNSISDFICENLKRIKHTDIRCSITSKKPQIENRADVISVLAASWRIDILISKIYGLSRNAALSLIKDNKVFINGSICVNNSRSPFENDIISVRGYGRFKYIGVEGETHKGNKKIKIMKWQH